MLIKLIVSIKEGAEGEGQVWKWEHIITITGYQERCSQFVYMSRNKDM
jgi:hypothetical protein